MTEGLACIALAAAHLEEQQKKEKVAIDAPHQSEGILLPDIPHRTNISETPRLVSNSIDSDEDPITDPEETLAQILASQPKETPAPPSPEDVITTVQPDDVLCGRGGETNHHPGNVQYRGLVKKYQRLYLKAKRRDKPKIARLIVDTVRRRSGRFLKKDPVAGVWKDVGNNKAREKTSQALREGAPEIRENDNKRKAIEYGAHVVSPTSSTASLIPIHPPTAYAAYEIVPATKKLKPSPVLAPPAPSMAIATGDPNRGPRLRILKSRLMSGETALEAEV